MRRSSDTIQGRHCGTARRPRASTGRPGAGQELRIVRLLRSFNLEGVCSLNDLGCGYGAALAVLSKHYPDAEVDYLGIDLSAEMIRLANTLWGHRKQTNFIVANASPRIADYSIASGIFHVKLEQTKDHWSSSSARPWTT